MSAEHGEQKFDLNAIKEQFAIDLIEVAPDLGSNGLARKYSSGLFDELVEMGAQEESDFLQLGEELFYHVGKDVLGPLAVQFVHEILEQYPGGKMVFLARDATPFYHIAKALVEADKQKYTVDHANLTNETFHRNFWGINDEQGGPNAEILTVEHPMVKKLLVQMGFGNGEPVTIVDVGAWGTMTDHLRQKLPGAQFNMHFFFSHLPEYISGYINQHAYGEERRTVIPEAILETVADTWEAFPKYQKRQTRLIELDNGQVIATGEESASPYLKSWHVAAIKGLEAAAREYVLEGKYHDGHAELLRLSGLIDKAAQGKFTGLLPYHTETWSGGAEWHENWPWGKIPPLK